MIPSWGAAGLSAPLPSHWTEPKELDVVVAEPKAVVGAKAPTGNEALFPNAVGSDRVANGLALGKGSLVTSGPVETEVCAAEEEGNEKHPPGPGALAAAALFPFVVFSTGLGAFPKLKLDVEDSVAPAPPNENPPLGACGCVAVAPSVDTAAPKGVDAFGPKGFAVLMEPNENLFADAGVVSDPPVGVAEAGAAGMLKGLGGSLVAAVALFNPPNEYVSADFGVVAVPSVGPPAGFAVPNGDDVLSSWVAVTATEPNENVPLDFGGAADPSVDINVPNVADDLLVDTAFIPVLLDETVPVNTGATGGSAAGEVNGATPEEVGCLLAEPALRFAGACGIRGWCLMSSSSFSSTATAVEFCVVSLRRVSSSLWRHSTTLRIPLRELTDCSTDVFRPSKSCTCLDNWATSTRRSVIA